MLCSVLLATATPSDTLHADLEGATRFVTVKLKLKQDAWPKCIQELVTNVKKAGEMHAAAASSGGGGATASTATAAEVTAKKVTVKGPPRKNSRHYDVVAAKVIFRWGITEIICRCKTVRCKPVIFHRVS